MRVAAVLFIVGLALIVAGVALWCVPAALIVAGAAMVCSSLDLVRRRS